MVTRADRIAQLEAQIETAAAECDACRVALGCAPSVAALARDYAAARQRLSRLRSALRLWKASRELARGPCRLLRLGDAVRLHLGDVDPRRVTDIARAHGYVWSSAHTAFIASPGRDAWQRGEQLMMAIMDRVDFCAR